MASPFPLSPAKIGGTAAITITQFPENPKTLILEQCKTIRDLNQIHARLIKTRLIHNPSIAGNLLESAAILLPEPMDYALSIFCKLDEPVSAAYNIMIRGFILKQSPHKALVLFEKMLENSVQPDEFTFSSIFKACSKLRSLKEGKQVHTQVFKLGLGSRGFIDSSLINMYGTCGEIGTARMVFDEMPAPERRLYCWNSMFSGYAKSGYWQEVVQLFRLMLDMNVTFDEITLVSVLTACGRLGDLELGEWINEYIEKNDLKGNPTLVTSLIDMYAKCGCVDTARMLFDKMSQRDVVAWSVMISGYTQANRCKEALSLFHEMQKGIVEPNEVTMVSVLSSCAVLGALETGRWVHFYIKKKKLKLTVNLGTSLMSFYAKCGSIDSSIDVFEKMPWKNVITWNVLIQGLANNGQGEKALDFFRLMLERNIEPNEATFIGVLCACSHAGLVDQGRNLFVSMSRDFDIEPRNDHYGCMVDILGRAGLIDEAYEFIKNMPLKPDAVNWRTLLASCKLHKNVQIAEESLKRVVELEPDHSGDYILLSSIYTSVGRGEDAAKLRARMIEKGIKKIPGCSLIELDGVIHEFFASDDKHPKSNEIYEAIKIIMERIKKAGYVANTEEVTLEVDEENKEVSVSHHSEKLAIAFGLISTSPRTAIRVTKNLRVCTDCHNATKLISKVFNREIVVRDRNRFHHFNNGTCSCNDYW